MRAKWENWMSCGEKSFTATGRLRRATLAEVAAWVVESWKGVKRSCILSDFKKAEIYPYDDNTVDSDVESSELTLMSNGCRSLVTAGSSVTILFIISNCFQFESSGVTFSRRHF
jgi:hypothetical protein